MVRLRRSFYSRDAQLVARDLLGKRLVRLHPTAGRISGIIVEAEAYSPNDAASHAYRGLTARNATMFSAAGHAYVYFTYGMHYCFNVVTNAVDIPGAVLIRALEPVEGIEAMYGYRSGAKAVRLKQVDLCSGPARLTLSLGIGRVFDGCDLTNRTSDLFIESGNPIPDSEVSTSPRVRVSGDAAALSAPWRYYITNSHSVSK